MKTLNLTASNMIDNRVKLLPHTILFGNYLPSGQTPFHQNCIKYRFVAPYSWEFGPQPIKQAKWLYKTLIYT